MASQPLDRILLDGWQIPATQLRAPIPSRRDSRSYPHQFGEGKRGSELGEVLALNYQSPEAPYKNN